MAILVKIAASRAVTWKDTEGVVWMGTAGVVWQNQDDSSTLYLSLDGEALTHYWDAFIASFASPQYQTKTAYGGMVELGFGQITLSPEAFSGNWPPPKQLTVEIQYTASTEAAAVTLFSGNIYLVSFDTESVTYNVNPPPYIQRLLDEGPDYDGNTVPYPRAFGTVTHVTPLRLSNDSDGLYRYHLGGISTTANYKMISAFSFVTATKVKIHTATNHGWSNGQEISIVGTVNFDGVFTIASKTDAAFVINRYTGTADGTSASKLVDSSATFLNRVKVGDIVCNTTDGTDTTVTSIADTELTLASDIFVSGENYEVGPAIPTSSTEPAEIWAAAYVAGTFGVFEDGVPVQSNVTVNGDGTFSLEKIVEGSLITMSGTASYTDLEGAATWVQSRLGLLSIDTTYQRATSPSVSCWLTSQIPVVDFLSDICAFFTHYFYIENNALHLGDMLLDAGSDTLDEFEYFDASYSAHDAVRQVMAEWTTHQSYEGLTEDEMTTEKNIKDINNRVVVSMYIRSSGTTTTTQTKKLVDTAATFASDGVIVGDVAYNVTDNTTSIIIAVSETAIELEDDIFVSGEEYEVGPSFPFGQELTVTPYHDTKSNVLDALQNIFSILAKDKCEIRIPMGDTLPNVGKRMTWEDNQLYENTLSWIRARNLTYNFENDEVIISGEGYYSSSGIALGEGSPTMLLTEDGQVILLEDDNPIGG